MKNDAKSCGEVSNEEANKKEDPSEFADRYNEILKSCAPIKK